MNPPVHRSDIERQLPVRETPIAGGESRGAVEGGVAGSLAYLPRIATIATPT
jgi:hypothetical protein